MRAVSLVGRIFFASLFLMGGVMKLQQFDINDGGQMMSDIQPKLDIALSSVLSYFPDVDIAKVQEFYPHMLLTAVVLELLGGILFVCNLTLGGYMLLAFMLAVTPVMHDFWNVEDVLIQKSETVQFMKNVMITGALLFWLAAPKKM